MASIPYEGVPQVSPDSRPPDDYQRIEASPNAFGAQIAKGVERAGQGAEQASENFFKTAQFYGQVSADDQSNKTQEAITHLLHGDPNKKGPDGSPDVGFFGLQGDAALRARPDVEKKMDEIVKQGRSGLSPQAQLQYDSFTRRYRTNASEKVGTFVDQQFKSYTAQTNEASAKLATDAIARNADSPLEVQAHTADLIHALTKNVQLHGGGPEQIAEAEARGAQIGLKTWLDQIATTDPSRAMRILDKNREIAGAQYDNLHKDYRVRAEQQNANTAADTEWNKAVGKGVESSSRIRPETASFLQARSGGARVQGLNPQFADRLAQASQDFESQYPGRRAAFESLTRTREEQAAAYSRFQLGQGGTAAPPGQSRHEYGLAADIPDGPFLNWLHANGDKYGLAFLPARLNDPGHVQLAGGGPASGAVPAAPSAARAALPGGEPIPQPGFIPAAGESPPPVTPATMPTITLAPPSAAMPAPGALPTLAIRYSEAMRGILDNQNLNDHERQMAETKLGQQYRAAAVAENQHVATVKQANDNAALGFTTKLGQLEDNTARPADYISLLKEINDNTDLDFKTKHELRGWVEASSGGKVAKTWGSGYWDVFQAVHAPEGDPGKITDPDQLLPLVRPGGPLTPAGYKEAVNEIRDAHSPQGQADAMTKKDFLDKVARPQISSTNPELHMYSEKGEANFLRFLTTFNSMYAKGKAGGLSTAQMLDPDSKEYLGKLIAPFKMTDADSFADAIKDKPPAPSWWSGRLQAMRELDAGARGQVAPPPAAPAAPAFDPSTIDSYTALAAAVRDGKISGTEANRIGRERKWIKAAPQQPQVPISK